MIRLTDEEISKIRYKYNELYKGGVFEHTMRPNHCELVAKAQLKKVVKWLQKHRAKDSVFVTFDTGSVEDCVLIKVQDWQALLEEVK